MPAISVVIPTYRHKDFVLQTLESVFAQTFTDFEVIVVNDGSPDETSSLLKPLAVSGKIRYVEQANAGQASARNRGIEEASGEYIALLDDDDLWEPDKLQWQFNLLRAAPQAALVYGQMRTFGEGLGYTSPGTGVVGGTTLRDFVGRVWINSPGQTLIRKSALQAVGGFDAKIWGTDDWDLYLNLAKSGAFIYEPKVALNYRYHADNASKNVRRLWQNGNRVANKHFGPAGGQPCASHLRESRTFVRRFISDDCFLHANYFASRGQTERATQLLLLALRVRPIGNLPRVVQHLFKRRYPRQSAEMLRRVARLRRFVQRT